jgi:hypothetical protein
MWGNNRNYASHLYTCKRYSLKGNNNPGAKTN